VFDQNELLADEEIGRAVVSLSTVAIGHEVRLAWGLFRRSPWLCLPITHSRQHFTPIIV
jgi:hypothetical protein